LYALGVSLKQALANLVFKALYLLADRGRRYAQVVRRSFHAADLAHLDEGTKGDQRNRSAHLAYSAEMSQPQGHKVSEPVSVAISVVPESLSVSLHAAVRGNPGTTAPRLVNATRQPRLGFSCG
jgi:hypothetical protein